MMEIASTNYLTGEFGMEDSTFFHQYPMDSFASTFDEQDFQYSFSSDSTSDRYLNSEIEITQNFSEARPTKKLKNNSETSFSKIISFEQFNAKLPDEKPKIEIENMDFAAFTCQINGENKVISSTRNQTQAKEHVIAERKRREKLNKNFIALSAIVPGLKKMDKASVLGDAIKYLKQLKERVETLETTNKAIETTTLVKRSILVDDDDDNDSHCDEPLREIEVRVSGKDVLIRTQSHKRGGRASIILAVLENHHLTVQSSSFLPFGNNIINVTIIARMKKETCVTAKDLLRSLQQALRQD